MAKDMNMFSFGISRGKTMIGSVTLLSRSQKAGMSFIRACMAHNDSLKGVKVFPTRPEVGSPNSYGPMADALRPLKARMETAAL